MFSTEKSMERSFSNSYFRTIVDKIESYVVIRRPIDILQMSTYLISALSGSRLLQCQM